METVGEWDAWRRRLSAVRRVPSTYTTNLYATDEQIRRWCRAGRLHAITTDRAVLLMLADRDFHHVYHAAEDQPALGEALAMLPAGSYTADLVGRGEALDRVCATHGASGFAPHALLRRMSLMQTPAEAGEGEAELAESRDAPEIAALLERLLDRFTEQLPVLDELRQAADLENLLIVRRGAVIAGMLMYELKGQLGHLRFWHVDDNARGEGVGRRLMSAFLIRCAHARRLMLWVIGDNTRSISIYRHYGFAEDGLLDQIMIFHKEQRQ